MQFLNLYKSEGHSFFIDFDWLAQRRCLFQWEWQGWWTLFLLLGLIDMEATPFYWILLYALKLKFDVGGDGNSHIDLFICLYDSVMCQCAVMWPIGIWLIKARQGEPEYLDILRWFWLICVLVVPDLFVKRQSLSLCGKPNNFPLGLFWLRLTLEWTRKEKRTKVLNIVTQHLIFVCLYLMGFHRSSHRQTFLLQCM